MRDKDKKLTSVKLAPELFDKFNEEKVKDKFSFQKLAERAVYLYLTNEEFRIQILNQFDTQYTGSL